MKTIARYLSPRTQVIRNMRERLAQMEKFNQVLHRCIEEDWRAHCRFVRLDDTNQLLVLSTDTQSLLMPLRFMQDSLLKQCQRHSPLFKKIHKIDCIYTAIHQPREHIRTPQPMSQQAAESFLQAAEHCPSALKNSLKKLAKIFTATTH